MKIGPAVRRIMPFWMEQRAAQIYRLIFVDLDKVAGHLAQHLPPSADVLDIGGGDGGLLNSLLARRADIRVTMVDIAPSVGRFLDQKYQERVRLCPNTPIEEHLGEAAGRYDAAIISDVMHHIPAQLRPAFILNVHRALKPSASFFIKDIEPGHPIATLSLYADKYISGDRGVELISMQGLTTLVDDTLPDREATELGLILSNTPNYILMFSERIPRSID